MLTNFATKLSNLSLIDAAMNDILISTTIEDGTKSEREVTINYIL